MKAKLTNSTLSSGTTVSAAFVTGMLAGCAARGMALDALLNHADIATDVLHQADTRIPLPRYAALYNHVTSVLDDEGFSLFSTPLRSGSFEFLCRSVVTAPTLEEALHRATRFLRLLLPDLSVSLSHEGSAACLRIAENRPLSIGRSFAFEWLLRLLHGLACWLVGRSLVLDSVAFPYPRPAHAADYALIYTADSRFDAPHLEARFQANLLALPIHRDEAALNRFLIGAPGRISTLYRRDRETATRVLDALRAGLPESLELKAIAARLYLSPRTLHRRLSAEGTSFQAIKDGLRLELAKEWLTKTRRPLSSIANDLGFADATAFYRAFMGWTGSAPTQYRKNSKLAL